MVLDASVVVKAYLNEPGTADATALVTGPRRLFAPELIRCEVARAICRRVSGGEIEPEEALVRCARWFAHLDADILSVVPDRELLPSAVELATDLRHALPDCLYLALARRLEQPLLTADRSFFERAVAVFPGSVHLLAA